MADLNTFYHHWKAVPYAMAAVTSSESFFILFHLMRKSKGCMSDEPIKISRVVLSKLIGKSRGITNKYINELKDLRLIFEEEGGANSTNGFVINWEEIEKIHSLTSKINDEGWCILREHCTKNGVIPFSELDESVRLSVYDEYKITYKNSTNDKNLEKNLDDEQFNENVNNNYQKYTENLSVQKLDAENTQRSEIEHCTYASVQKLNGDNVQRSEIERSQDFSVQKLNGKKSQRPEIERSINPSVQKLNAEKEPNLTKNDDFVNNFLNNDEESENMKNIYKCENSSVQKLNVLPSFSVQKLNTVYRDIYKEKIKETRDLKNHYKERDEGLKDFLEEGLEDKQTSSIEEKNIWNEFRDLSYPSYTSQEIKAIIDNSQFYDSDSDKLIREVWNEIEEDEELPVCIFNDLLFAVWSDLKEQHPDFSLTEEQAKNIFGFSVVEHEGEYYYKITPSSIRNINELPESTRKPFLASRINERMSRSIFACSIIEIANKSLEMLTNIEYAIWLLDDFVEERKERGQSRPDEVTALQFSDLLKDISENSGVSYEDLEDICKNMRKKKNSPVIHLRADAVSVDKITKYNADHQEESEVEKLWREKLAEEGYLDS